MPEEGSLLQARVVLYRTLPCCCPFYGQSTSVPRAVTQVPVSNPKLTHKLMLSPACLFVLFREMVTKFWGYPHLKRLMLPSPSDLIVPQAPTGT